MRYGLKEGVCRSIDEVGRYFGVTRERVRQIEAKAFKKLLKIFNSSYKHSSDSSPAESSGKGWAIFIGICIVYLFIKLIGG